MSLDHWHDKRVLVTGADGFLGGHLCGVLQEEGALVRRVGHGRGGRGGPDLCLAGHVHSEFENARDDLGGYPEIVFHLAGYNGGIYFNENYPFEIFHQNTLMGLNVLSACARRGVGKVVSAVASCAYGDTDLDPDYALHRCPDILREGDFLGGRPHPSVACHGYAKRNLQLASSFARRGHGLHAVCVCPTSLYGPRDRFDEGRAKVVGALVARFVQARREGAGGVTVWGSGRPLREFLYARDAARLLARAALLYDDSDLPLNLGSGQEVSVRTLAGMVALATGYEGDIHFDQGRPDGQARKRLDLSRMRDVLGDFPFTPLQEGIKRTVAWYEGNYV